MLNPPHANDYPMMHRMASIGIEPGKPFSLAAAPAEARQAFEAAAASALKVVKAGKGGLGVSQNGWRTNLSTIGTYGSNYPARAVIAYSRLGANLIEDAIYPSALTDADGKPMSSDNRYVMHFTKEQIPPVHGFWSLTMCDERQLFTANPIHRRPRQAQVQRRRFAGSLHSTRLAGQRRSRTGCRYQRKGTLR